MVNELNNPPPRSRLSTVAASLHEEGASLDFSGSMVVPQYKGQGKASTLQLAVYPDGTIDPSRTSFQSRGQTARSYVDTEGTPVTYYKPPTNGAPSAGFILMEPKEGGEFGKALKWPGGDE